MSTHLYDPAVMLRGRVLKARATNWNMKEHKCVKDKKARKRIWAIVFSAFIFLFTLWMIWSNVTVGITHYIAASKNLPHDFDHYKIAVVSDLHNASFGNGNDIIVETIRSEQPDIIAVTGDLVDANRTDIEISIDLIEELVKIAPCYYVTGNHEAWIGAQYQELEKQLLELGVVVLHDAVCSLNNGNSYIQIAGLDDPDFTDRDTVVQESILRTKLQQMNLTDDYCVLLSHRPETFHAYVSENIDLVLSGHAHGGQFRIPFVGGVVAPNQGLFPQFDAGTYAENNTTMIVSRGIGNSIIPVRFNNRPEIVIVELVCE